MNKIFKIVFNAARGKMMVVNEATSSVQTGKKAAVTVAVVAALASGVAIADGTDKVYEGLNNGQAGGALNHSSGSLVLDGYQFKDNTSSGDLSAAKYNAGLGGAVYSKADLEVIKSTFDSNEAIAGNGSNKNAKGGAIHLQTGRLSVVNSTFTGNESGSYGGAISLDGSSADNVIQNSVFGGEKANQGNKSGSHGGAMHVQNASVTLSGNTFTNNSAGGRGGAILFRSNAVATFEGVNTFVGNSAATGGGALGAHQSGAELTFAADSVSVFENNTAVKLGGAIRNDALITFEKGSTATFVGNEAVDGGAINNADEDGGNPVLKLEGTVAFENNKASTDGGAIWNGTTGQVNVTGSSKFIGNTAGDWGGAIMNYGTLAVKGGVFEGNSANVGGAIAVSKVSTATTIEGASFVNNEATADGGAIGAYGPLSVKNSIFTGNVSHATESQATPIGGGAISLGAVSSVEVSSIEDTVFSKNTSDYNGGAVATRQAQDGSLKDATYKIEATFTENKAANSGGAIWNSFYKDVNAENTGVLVSGAFSKNEAGKDGGAIYNAGWESDANETSNGGAMTINNSTFAGNSAALNGGAIYNAGTLHLTGTNTFTGNKAGGKANDVYNVGTMNISGTAKFEGGITGFGTVNMDEGSTLSIGGKNEIGSLTGNGITLELASSSVEITKNALTNTTVVASGSVNDAVGGGIHALAQLLNVADDSLKSVSMAEGSVMGVVTMEDGKVEIKVNKNTEALVEQVNVAPQMVTRIMMNDVRKRMGDLRAAEGTHGAWARYNGGQMSGQGMDADFHMVQVGVDTVPVADAPRFGVAFSYAQTEAEGNGGLATTEMDSFSLAFYGTKMYDSGMFVDVIGRMTTMDTEMNVLGSKAKMDNVALSLSGELGWRFDVTDKFFFEPSVEATYTYTNAETFTRGIGNYKLEAVDSLVGRAGFAAGFKCPANKGDVYVRAAVVREFMGDTTMRSGVGGTFTAAPIVTDGKDTWFEYAIGANFNLNKNTYVYADLERTSGANVDEDWRANVGVRYAF